MGGGIAVLMLGTIFGWMLGVIPIYALITVIRPGIFLPLRILFALLFSAVVVVLLWWAASNTVRGGSSAATPCS